MKFEAKYVALAKIKAVIRLHWMRTVYARKQRIDVWFQTNWLESIKRMKCQNKNAERWKYYEWTTKKKNDKKNKLQKMTSENV